MGGPHIDMGKVAVILKSTPKERTTLFLAAGTPSPPALSTRTAKWIPSLSTIWSSRRACRLLCLRRSRHRHQLDALRRNRFSWVILFLWGAAVGENGIGCAQRSRRVGEPL